MIIAAMSDLHGNLPEIPKCDVLVIAGDICPDRTLGSPRARNHPDIQAGWMLKEMGPWLEKYKSNYRRVFATWGNHDFIGEALEHSTIKLKLPFELVVDDSVTVDGITFWLSPWSPQGDLTSKWAFMAEDDALERRFDPITAGIDVIVNHAPPYGFGDVAGVPYFKPVNPHLGSRSLVKAIERVQPKAVICGHIHGGYGKYRMTENTVVYNVAIVNEAYKPVNEATIIKL